MVVPDGILEFLRVLIIHAIHTGAFQHNIGFNFNPGLDNTSDEILWRDEILNPAAGIITDSKSTQIMMNEFFVHTGTGLGIYVNGINGNANISATISFNPIAEWVNFREPTYGARI